MPRKPRFYIPKVPVHVVQRGHSSEPVFIDDGDYTAYLSWLGQAAEKHGCVIHAYVLMTNHVHILTTPDSKDSVGAMLQMLSRHFGPYLNYQYGTSGSIWEGRYKASLVQDDYYFLSCMRYIELNPVRAAMVRTARDYRWSSYRANAVDKADDLLTPHAEYLKLGKTKRTRLIAYRDLFKAHQDEEELASIRAAWQTGTPLGNALFKEKIERKLKLKIGHAKRGRPSKPLNDN